MDGIEHIFGSLWQEEFAAYVVVAHSATRIPRFERGIGKRWSDGGESVSTFFGKGILENLLLRLICERKDHNFGEGWARDGSDGSVFISWRFLPDFVIAGIICYLGRKTAEEIERQRFKMGICMKDGQCGIVFDFRCIRKPEIEHHRWREKDKSWLGMHPVHFWMHDERSISRVNSSPTIYALQAREEFRPWLAVIMFKSKMRARPIS